MQTPLLESSTTPHCSKSTAFFTFVLFTFAVSPLALSKIRPSTPETQLGVVNLEWSHLVPTYFGVASLSRLMRTGSEYRGKEPLVVNYEQFCFAGTRRCRQICVEKQQAESAASSSTSSMPTDEYCIHEENICWEVSKMRCWNSEGGIKIWDGNHDWDLIFHMRFRMTSKRLDMYVSSNLPWLHMRSVEKKIDFFVFAWGTTRQISSICSELSYSAQMSDRNFPAQLQTVPSDHAIVVSGHSEGAGWAVCANDLMIKRRIPNERRVIGTGAIVADEYFYNEYVAKSPPEHNLFMLTAVLVDLKAGAEIVPDLFPTTMTNTGISFPQFSYACTMNKASSDMGTNMAGAGQVRCLNPQPEINLQESRRIAKAYDLESSGILITIHSLKVYQNCYQACIPMFRSINWNFEANVASIDLKDVPKTGLSRIRSMPQKLQQMAIPEDEDVNRISQRLNGITEITSPGSGEAGPSSAAGTSAIAGVSHTPVPPSSHRHWGPNQYWGQDIRHQQPPNDH